MKRTNIVCLLFLTLIMIVITTNCTNIRLNNFSFRNTLSIFIINNEKESFLCIPVQYMGDYHIGEFEFSAGSVLIGDYEIQLNRDDINIYIYLKEEADEDGSADSGFKQIYSEENGNILLSKMNEPLTVTPEEFDGKINHYYIFIEKFLNKNDIKKINTEYKKGNIKSLLSIKYDLVMDNEAQNGNGMIDDFELYEGIAIDPVWFPPNLNFFKAKYLK